MFGNKKKEYKLKLATKLDALIKKTQQEFAIVSNKPCTNIKLYDALAAKYNVLIEVRELLKLEL